jgi:hypothetical protein
LTEETKILTDDLIDLCNALEASVIKLRNQIQKLYPSGLNPVITQREWSWNPERITWETKEGWKGTYLKTEELNNPDFQEMQKDLAAHQGSLMRDGWFYWLFQNGTAVGRKKQ